MTYYLFPKAFIHPFMSTDPISESEQNFSPSLRFYLSDILQQLHKIGYIDHLSNAYHFLYNSNGSEGSDVSSKMISKINVLGTNRLFYYELLELFQTVHLSMDMYYPIRIFFIGERNMNMSALQCIQRIRNQSISDEYHLFSSDLESDSNVTIHPSGDTYLTIENLERCIVENESSMELIISDALLPFMGETHDYIQQYEYQTTRIAMLQVCFALCMQKKNGIFILKLGDCFSPLSVDLVCIISSFYNKTYFTKPTVSNSSSSCRFIVCKGFMHDNVKEYHPILLDMFKNVLSSGVFGTDSNTRLSRFVKWNISKMFIMKVEEMNSIFGQPQLEQLQHIHSILTHKYKNDKTNHLIKTNMQKCIQWCIKHKIPFRNI